MSLKRTLILLCLALLVVTGTLYATDTAPAAETKKANISMDEARAIALAEVPGGTVDAEELSRVAGKLTYFFDVRTEAKKGVDVVAVLASDGTVVEVKHKTEWAVRRDAQEKRRNSPKNDG